MRLDEAAGECASQRRGENHVRAFALAKYGDARSKGDPKWRN